MGDGPSRRNTPRKSTLRTRSRSIKYTHKNPYINFLIEYKSLPENKSKNVREVFKCAGSKWKLLSDREKSPYVKAALAIRNKLNRDKKHSEPNKREPHGKQPMNEPLMPPRTKEQACPKCGERHSGKCYRRRDVWKLKKTESSNSSKTSAVSEETDSVTTPSGVTKTRTTLFDSVSSVTTF
ncbi:PREDICTED: uncharacterized protein LOC108560276 [Nicrophorus vespilloides]|uniref:Uncharacterized protein LOC108560276 n=1 Tax=Nicrophorus vespilloides TaxID=110193 RepID=A0ABM1MF89_NICVS|nr:PREDICTED: uncharacterized protein LOC108560276 [Nicrophorus vespilloides]